MVFDMEDGGMVNATSLRFELEGRLRPLSDAIGKHYVSVRWEPAPRIVRVGACISEFAWEPRSQVLDALLEFERDHADEFAVEFDIVPFDAVMDHDYAEA